MSKKPKKKTSRHLFVVDVGAIEGPAQHTTKELGGSFVYTENFYPKGINGRDLLLRPADVRPSKERYLAAVNDRFQGGKSMVVLGFWTPDILSKDDLNTLGLTKRDITYLRNKTYTQGTKLKTAINKTLEKKANRKSLFGHLCTTAHRIKAGIKGLWNPEI